MKPLSLLSLVALFPLLMLACEGGVEDLSSLTPERSEGFQTAPAPPTETGATQPNTSAPSGFEPPGESSPSTSGGANTGPTPGAPQGSDDADTGLNCASVYEQVSACYTTYYTCASACGDDACAQSCEADYMACYGAQVALGSSAAKAAFDALRTCEDSNWDPCYESGGVVYDACAAACGDEACTQACANDANTVLQTCMSEACAQTYAECGVNVDGEATAEPEPNDPGAPNGSGSDSGSAPSYGMTCGELYTCEDNCQGNQNCGQACYDQGTDQAKSQWTQLIQCGMSYCNGQVASAEEYKTCLSQMCPQEYGVCFSASGSNGPSGSGSGSSVGTTCGEGYNCIQSCYSTAFDESSFYSCVDGCNNAMSSQAKVLMDSLTSCADSQCYDVPGSLANYYKCIEDFCTNDYMACIDQPAGTPDSGSGASSDINTCLDVHVAVTELCVPTYATCMDACSDQNCAESCGGQITACIEAKQNAAPYQAGQDFGAVLACRQSHFDTCNSEADAVFATCDAACAAGDQACLQGCVQSSDDAYEACYVNVCASEYATCGISASGANSSEPTSPEEPLTPSESHDSCVAIYEAVQAVCDAGYVSCSQACGDQACADACANEANACVDTQVGQANDPNDGVAYEAVLACWNTHYESCYAEGGEIFEGCMASCTDGEDACKQSCNTPAMDAYAQCYSVSCANEYATCGIE